MNNIILIGMPGCGKTSLGKELSRKLKLDFVDVDEYIVKKNNMSIEEMFKKSEEYFRDKETQAIWELSKLDNTIIATGGGVIKKEENMKLLLNCGYVVFIHRKPEEIIHTVDISSRPLLKSDSKRIYDLFNERYELYKKYSNLTIDNSGTFNEALGNLISMLIDVR